MQYFAQKCAIKKGGQAWLIGQSCPSYVILDERFRKFCECRRFEEFENTINY